MVAQLNLAFRKPQASAAVQNRNDPAFNIDHPEDSVRCIRDVGNLHCTNYPFDAR
jgi:hypothetical protein